MKFGDRILQRWRIAKAARWIEPGSRLLDIGCADGAIFKQLGNRIREGIGVDPDVKEESRVGRGRLIRGFFPDDLPDRDRFDAITMLAVLEHIPQSAQAKLASDCARYMNPGARLIVTVPSPFVDRILDVLKAMRIVDGMSLEEHYGFRPEQTPAIFEPAGLKRIRQQRFQVGLNHLFVFQNGVQTSGGLATGQPAAAQGVAPPKLAFTGGMTNQGQSAGFDIST